MANENETAAVPYRENTPPAPIDVESLEDELRGIATAVYRFEQRIAPLREVVRDAERLAKLEAEVALARAQRHELEMARDRLRRFEDWQKWAHRRYRALCNAVEEDPVNALSTVVHWEGQNPQPATA